ncbi:uncharacterized protein [Prorops nasuta]|uniref:uncharacterized protein n=1 Tax=Prorops nasuta TaxID=863751 RepID=UPI0034CEE449
MCALLWSYNVTIYYNHDLYQSYDKSNCAFLFDEIPYESNGIEIDRCRNVGITSTLKNLVSLSTEESASLRHSGWFVAAAADRLKEAVKNFSFCVPLKMLLGFCEDYRRVVVNARHELVLIRAHDDTNAIYSLDKITNSSIKLLLVQWSIPHVTLNEITKLQFLSIVEQDKSLSLDFRVWELYEYPLLPKSQRHTWSVKASTQLEKP